MAYNRKDFFFHQAKKENYAARSIFKLEEIDQRFRLIKSGFKILDLGAAPGSWSQYCSKKVGPKGRVLGIDLQEVGLSLPNATFICADLRSLDLEQTMRETGIEPPYDMVVSDMAPRTSGIRERDQQLSLELCELALEIAVKHLRPKGHFICKFFHSDDFDLLRKKILAQFEKVEAIRPKSTRKESKEIFLIGIGFKAKSAEKKG